MKWKMLLLLCTPFLLMIIVNEGVRSQIEKEQSVFGLSTINADLAYPQKCSWACHHNTNYCKSHHVKNMESYFKYLDPIYFGMINFLKSTDHYRMANLFFLVFLWPLLLFVLLFQSIQIQKKIIKIKTEIEHPL